MKGLTHLAAGALAGYALASTEPSQSQLLITGISAIGGLLPDIDIGTSKIARLCRPAAYTIQILFGHRGIFHSPLLWLVLSGIWFLSKLDQSFWILAAISGVGTHLMLDMFNPAGIPLFWPIPKHIHLAKFRSGGFLDFFLGLTLLGLLLFLLLGSTPHFFPLPA